ncbi:tudor domain-containing protein 3 [Homalodisca vitripennis]|nr:tudor domain-containing protein 3 [Homalodisca vitripennis]
MSYTFPSIPARPMTSLVKWEEVLYCILPLCRVCSVYVSTSPLSNTILFVPLDLREISVPFFPEDIAKGKLEVVPGNVIVQVQKVRNISAPKANEDSQAAPRMLKIVLTDGHTVCHAIEVETVSVLSSTWVASKERCTGGVLVDG